MPRQNSDAQIFKGKFTVEPFEVPNGEERWEPAVGLDFGFSRDPSALALCWVADEGRTVYIEHEIYKVGLELDQTGPEIKRVPGVENCVIRADCSRPESISFIRNHSGLRVEPCVKWKNSVLDGIAWLRSRERIVIHPRCKHMIEEARLYSYKTDRLSGDVLPDVTDKHNHLWDAVRYGLENWIQASTSLGIWSRL